MSEKKFAVLGYDTINIGDDIQSFVASTIIKPSYIIMRDDYDVVYDFDSGERVELKEEVHLIMNGWFMHGVGVDKPMTGIKFPYKNDFITPVFISTCISKDCPELFEDESIEYLKKYSPILCRDKTTAELLSERGVKTEFYGCLTTTLNIDNVPENPEYEKKFKGQTLLVHGNDLFRLHNAVGSNSAYEIDHYIQDLKELNPKERIESAGDLLSQYRYASKIYTTRLHCFLPSKAMGVNVEFITADGKDCYRTKDLVSTESDTQQKLKKFFAIIEK